MSSQRKGLLQACLAKSSSLNNLVEYAEDSVVSKTIIDKDAGTITLFAFDKGQNLSEHTSPYDAVVEVVDGVGVFTIDGKDVQASAGELLIMPGNVPHSVSAEQRFKMLLTMIRTKAV